MTQATQQRVKRFIDGFIRSTAVETLTSERNNDFWNYPERSQRVYDSAEYGCDGMTHNEVINDWRNAFETMLQDRRNHEYPERFATAVNAHFDSVESWHEQNGSLFQEIG